MRLTNAQRGTLIDALDDAILLMRSSVDGVTPFNENSTDEDRENVREWRASLRRYRALRRVYRGEEQISTKVRKKDPHTAFFHFIHDTRKGGAA